MILPYDQLCHICIKLGCCFSGMIKAKASGSKVYLYFMKKGRQARHRIPRNSCYLYSACMANSPNPEQSAPFPLDFLVSIVFNFVAGIGSSPFSSESSSIRNSPDPCSEAFGNDTKSGQMMDLGLRFSSGDAGKLPANDGPMAAGTFLPNNMQVINYKGK